MAATLLISELRNVEIVGIQFEDGSGYSFNYETKGKAWVHITFNKQYQDKLEMLLRQLAMNTKTY